MHEPESNAQGINPDETQLAIKTKVGRIKGVVLREKDELTESEVEDGREAANLEKRSLEILAIERQATQNHGLKQDIKQRGIFSYITFGLIGAWLVSVQVLLWVVAFGKASVAESVLIALLSSTTATVVGLLWLVMKYLFNDKAQ